MRTNSLLAISSLTNLGAGALFAASAWQDSATISFSMIGGGAFLLVGVTGWAAFKIRNSVQALTKQSEANQSTAANSGLGDLDAIGQQFASAFQKQRAESIELAETKHYLKKIDRRDGSFDRHGNPIPIATQLQGILRGYGSELNSNVSQALSCGLEIRRSTDELVTGSQAQADAVNQAATVVERLTTRAMTLSETAEGAMMSSGKIHDKAIQGLEQIEELIEEMKQVRNHSAARERKMQALGKHTKEIESIVQAIGTISSRTDLLALNASIESVRAGEHGRGFAVVAEEVRALAEQSAQAVSDITRRIEMIQLEAHKSISVSSGEHDQMHQVISRAAETMNFLKEFSATSNRSSEELVEICQGTRQQLKLTQELVEALEVSSETAKRNRSQAEGAQWSARTLTKCGDQFDRTLQLFRLAGALEQERQILRDESEPRHRDIETANANAMEVVGN